VEKKTRLRSPGSVVREPIGQLDGVGVRVRPDREERELLRLLGRNLGEALAPVTGVDDEEAAEAVDVLASGGVPDVVALALDDDGHAVLLRRRLAGEVHPEVVFGLLLEIVVVGCTV
jgi:hypothetical protein